MRESKVLQTGKVGPISSCSTLSRSQDLGWGSWQGLNIGSIAPTLQDEVPALITESYTYAILEDLELLYRHSIFLDLNVVTYSTILFPKLTVS